MVDAKQRKAIRKEDGELVIREPQVTMMDIKGQKTFQISGRIEEKQILFKEEDVKLAIEQTGKSKEEVELILTETKGDIAEAILKLTESQSE